MLRGLVLLLALLVVQVPLPVRIGVVSFQDGKPPFDYKLLLKADPPLDARAATGTYAELQHWLRHDLVDAAVVNPGLYATLTGDDWEYLGSGNEDGHSVLLKRKGQALDLKGPVQLLAVDPLSVTGYLHPLAALRSGGAEVKPRFTWSHSNSLKALAQSQGHVVAGVWAQTWRDHPDPALEVVELAPLGALVSPPVALIGRKGTPATRSLAAFVKAGKVPGFRFDPGYEAAIRALPTVGEGTLDHVDLDDLVLTLQQYNSSHPQRARFAVVLAGGGAKCSYQAGAMRALEEKLAPAGLDVDLVVGTSGGAINAISVALGLTKTPEGYAKVRQAWAELDQREIICPPRAVRINLWCWFACLAGLPVFVLAWRLGWSRNLALGLTLVLGLGLAGLARVDFPFRHSTAQHVWAWLSWGVEGAGWVLVAAAVLGLVVRVRFPIGRVLIAGVTLLPLLQTWTMFCYEEVVSENRGLEAILTRSFARLIDSQAGTMQELSRDVFSRKLLQRDLVVTASPLTDPKLALPGEFYFYASPREGKPEFGRRGVALADRPELLFDALLGSAAIYPLFPSRHIADLPEKGQSVELVDGSFAHRSPLEAAVSWGATHVLLIEASTQEVSVHGKLLDNFGQALNYLYDEAQLVDVRLKGQTVLFTLYPSIPHIGLLDFSRGFIEESIEKGYREAAGTPTGADQRGGALRKDLGPPRF